MRVKYNQKDIDYQYKILSYTDELCIINWQMTRTLMPSNIKQWRYTR